MRQGVEVVFLYNIGLSKKVGQTFQRSIFGHEVQKRPNEDTLPYVRRMWKGYKAFFLQHLILRMDHSSKFKIDTQVFESIGHPWYTALDTVPELMLVLLVSEVF